ncbi:FAD-dependent oxidoreductase [Bradyrhizobium sp. BR 10289]|uniref:FAD-dependent oxidoreductase n=1 Tax=Bradyrhizobium sp. BR 10289 TaxID=2749993 RepID=UPI001C6470EB|nr:FAD-dependent oxidoreductase [Bradyrhizobium sp. BR 10289]MBW7970139.1 FAD-dependent oxidoreductase [Bradyrhizobium sp. BR 10289]
MAADSQGKQTVSRHIGSSSDGALIGIDRLNDELDVIVIGSGAAGLTAAVRAAFLGLKVIVLEKADVLGGTTAWSAGAAWLPGSRHLADEANPDAASTYLRNLLGNGFDPPLIEAMLSTGPEVVEFLEAHTDVRFRAFGGTDYRTDVDGASLTGRTLEPAPFDDRAMGGAHRLVRGPFQGFTLFNGMQVDRADISNLSRAMTSSWALLFSALRLARHASDLVRFGRSSRRVRGNALVAMLIKSALALGVGLHTGAACAGLIRENGKVSGVKVLQEGEQIQLRARQAVVLATGGFSANSDWKTRHAPYAEHHRGMPPTTNSADGLRMALEIGARMASGNSSDYCFAPVSSTKLSSGGDALFPHFARDRCLPGCIAVGKSGRRFVNEGCSYHDFVLAMHSSGAVPAYLICDHQFLRRYGLGMVRPFPFPYGRYVRNGYLKRAKGIRQLASALEIDPEETERTVHRMNEYAVSGIDVDFRKGDDAHSRSQGDALHRPNPTLGPIEKPPYYAIEIVPGDTGTTCGLVTNADAQVLDSDNLPIDGLYACGMDMNNPTLGVHPSSGCNIGPALVFGFRAANNIKKKALTAVR